MLALLFCLSLASVSCKDSKIDKFNAYLTDGNEAASRGDLSAARTAFAAASTLKPKAPDPYFALGYAECAQDKLKECREAFEQAEKLLPNGKSPRIQLSRTRQLSAAYLALGEAYSRQSSWDDVLNYTRASLTLDNTSEWAPRVAWRLAEALEMLAFQEGGGWVSNQLGREALQVYNISIHLPAFPETDPAIRAVCLLGLGILHLRMGHLDEAVRYLKEGLNENPDEKDARMATSQLINIFYWQNKTDDAQAAIEQSIERRLWEHPDQTPPKFKLGVPHATPWPDISRYSSILKQIQILEEATSDIKAEMLAAMNRVGLDGIKFGTMEPMTEDDGNRGAWHTKHIDCCKGRESFPLTCEALDEVRKHGNVMSAQFLRLQPGGVIRSHCGGNDRWVLHLGLLAPPNVSITVGGVSQTWTEGKAFVFDDSFRHFVSHNGQSDRVVLGLQISNPEYEKTLKTAPKQEI